jgi:glycosyltransferase involved in cell wall biosynthesis
MKISAVVPCYNYERYLPAAIESLLEGTRCPDEIIVVDDGSTDRSADVARRYPEVTLVEKPNGGMASALNAGFSAAKGDVVVMLDADDLAGPDRVAWVEAAFADPEVCLAWHPLHIMGAGAKPGRFLLPNSPLPSGDIADAIATEGLPCFAVTSGMAVRATALDRIGKIPEDSFRKSSEGYLVRTLPFIGRVAATDEPLGVYRSHTASQIRFLPNRDTEAVGAKLREHLDIADAEHALLSAAATAAGHPVSVPRLRALDPVYLDYHRWCSRLGAPTRRDAWRTFRRLQVDYPRRLTHRRVATLVFAAFDVVLPKAFAKVAFLIRHDHDLTGPLRQLARAYWVMRAARASLANRLGRR